MTTLANRLLVGGFLLTALVSGTALAEGPEVVAVTATQRGDILVERSGGTRDEPLRLVGGTFVVRRLLLSPDGTEVVILAADVTNLDWASRVFAFNPKQGTLRTIYDTFADRWNGPHFLLDAAVQAGRSNKRYPDNDLTDIFYDVKGVLHFTNEDRDTFAVDIQEGAVVGVSLVREVALAPKPKVEETKVGDERAFRILLPLR